MDFAGKRTLSDLENELLRLLNETRGSLLEDAQLFSTLQTSKATSETVKSSLEIAEKTEVQIDLAREVCVHHYSNIPLPIKFFFRVIDLVLEERPFCFLF